MTTTEAKGIAKAHWPNMVVLCLGAALVSFSVQNPEQSADLVNKLIQFVGYLIAGGGLLNSARMGVKQEAQDVKSEVQQVKQDVQNIAPPSPQLASVVAESVSSAMTRNLSNVQDSVLLLHKALDSKHEENIGRHDELVSTLAADRKSNDEQHEEHRRNFAELRGTVGKIVDKIGGIDEPGQSYSPLQ